MYCENRTKYNNKMETKHIDIYIYTIKRPRKFSQRSINAQSRADPESIYVTKAEFTGRLSNSHV